MHKHLVVSVAFASILAFGSAAAESVIYKWTSDEGVTQYTQAPPQGREYEMFRLVAGGPSPAVESSPPAEAAEPPPARDPATVTVADVDAERQQYCESARNNLLTLQAEVQVVMASEEDSEEEPVLLNGEQRAEQIALAQRQVTMFCRD